MDLPLARDTYLQALSATMFAGHLAQGSDLREAAMAPRAAPPLPTPCRAADLLLDALALLFTENARASASAMRQALHAFLGQDVSAEDELRWLWLVFITAMAQWDDEAGRELTDRHVRLARETGALAVLPLVLSSRIIVHLFEGDLAEATTLSEEVGSITAATGMRITNYGAVALAAWRGRAAEADRLSRPTEQEITGLRAGPDPIRSPHLQLLIVQNSLYD
ncbi:hypothetical protein ACIO93_43835 [Streptomyces sp. NPDC087903]|uniref:hypothetical protein n=1 Tax=Streptomyces sp. NPDC087903 TaxID=3365819 RepID=UPI0038016E74